MEEEEKEEEVDQGVPMAANGTPAMFLEDVSFFAILVGAHSKGPAMNLAHGVPDGLRELTGQAWSDGRQPMDGVRLSGGGAQKDILARKMVAAWSQVARQE